MRRDQYECCRWCHAEATEEAPLTEGACSPGCRIGLNMPMPSHVPYAISAGLAGVILGILIMLAVPLVFADKVLIK